MLTTTRVRLCGCEGSELCAVVGDPRSARGRRSWSARREKCPPEALRLVWSFRLPTRNTFWQAMQACGTAAPKSAEQTPQTPQPQTCHDNHFRGGDGRFNYATSVLAEMLPPLTGPPPHGQVWCSRDGMSVDAQV